MRTFKSRRVRAAVKVIFNIQVMIPTGKAAKENRHELVSIKQTPITNKKDHDTFFWLRRHGDLDKQAQRRGVNTISQEREDSETWV